MSIFPVGLNEDGKGMQRGSLNWPFYSVLLAPNTEGNSKVFGNCPWCCCPAVSVGDGFQKQVFLKVLLLSQQTPSSSLTSFNSLILSLLLVIS